MQIWEMTTFRLQCQGTVAAALASVSHVCYRSFCDSRLWVALVAPCVPSCLARSTASVRSSVSAASSCSRGPSPWLGSAGDSSGQETEKRNTLPSLLGVTSARDVHSAASAPIFCQSSIYFTKTEPQTTNLPHTGCCGFTFTMCYLIHHL